MKRFIFGLAILAGHICLAALAGAHGGHDPRLKITANNGELRFETGISADVFIQFDVNKDKVLTVAEFTAAYANIAAWLDTHVKLTDQDGKTLKPYFSDSPIINAAYLSVSDSVTHVKVLRRFKFKDVTALKLDVALFDYPPVLSTSRVGKMDAFVPISLCLQQVDSAQLCKDF